MMRSMFAAISGLKIHQMMLDVTANDIANVNTLGYKSAAHDVQGLADRSSSAAPRRRTPATAARTPPRSASASQLGSIDNLMSAGALQTTGNPLDVAIQGDGLFRVGNADPAAGAGPITNVQYTRAGNFTRNDAGLPGHAGRPVRRRPHGRRPAAPTRCIQVPAGATDVVDRPGRRASPTSPAGGGAARRPPATSRWRRSPNEAGLERVAGNRWAASANSGAETVGTPGRRLRRSRPPGAIEMSNVDLAQSSRT